jgi:hypothetical protein
MNTKNHKQNTNFQIAYFLVGSCHTPDGAYSLLCELKEERQAAVNNYAVTELRNKAKEIRNNKLFLGDEADVLEAQAELLEMGNNKKTSEILYQAALDELKFIDKCFDIIQPLRQYKDLPDSEAHEAAQLQEWKFELIHRAENAMLTTGGIPTDHFATMRMHPSFQTEILPRINEMKSLMLTKGGADILQKQITGSKFENINKLIG